MSKFHRSLGRAAEADPHAQEQHLLRQRTNDEIDRFNAELVKRVDLAAIERELEEECYRGRARRA